MSAEPNAVVGPGSREGALEEQIVGGIDIAGLGRKLLWRSLLLLLTGISLYALAPSLLEVFSSWPQLADLDPTWIGVMLVFEAATFVCTWEVQRIALHTRRMFAVATSQLAGNAFGRVIPGGAAAQAALQYRMLARAGIPTSRAASGLTAVTVLMFATLLVLPVFALPVIIPGGTPVADSLALAAWIGVGVFVLMFATGVVFFAWGKPIELVARGSQWILNGVRRSEEPTTDLPERLTAERDFIRRTLGRRWWQALAMATFRWGFDYFALVAALLAVGAQADPALVLLAYVAAQLLGMVPFTPGGLGFVEAGLTGALVLAGVSAGDAVIATLTYRLASFWLPLPFGALGYGLFRWRFRRPDALAGKVG